MSNFLRFQANPVEDIQHGDRIKITPYRGVAITGTVRTAVNYGGRDGWYIEMTRDGGGYLYWKQGPDGGTVEKVSMSSFLRFQRSNPIGDETYDSSDIARMHDDLRNKNHAVIKGIHVEVKRTTGRKRYQLARYDQFDLYINDKKVWTGEATSIDPLNIAGGTFEAFVEHALQQAGITRARR